MGLVKHMAKEFFKEVDDKSREFFEFVLPPIDLHEKNGNLIVTVDIPGFDKNDIKITMNGNILSINAEKKDDVEDLTRLTFSRYCKNSHDYCRYNHSNHANGFV